MLRWIRTLSELSISDAARFASGLFGSVKNVVASDAARFVEDSPYEVNTNDSADAIFNELFKQRGDIFAHFDRDYRLDAEEKADLECRNSGHGTGATRRFANDIVGKSGPTLQVMSNDHYEFPPELAQEYQEKAAQWFADMKLHRKTKTMLRATLSRGEGLGMFHPVVGTRERQLFPNPIAVNFRLFDARRLDTADRLFDESKSEYVDGIKYDAYGLPSEYRIDTRNIADIRAESASGSQVTIGVTKPKFQYVQAENVAHLFLEDVPEQRRGFTQFVAGMLPSSLARKTAMSITKAMRNLAMLFGFLEQDAVPEGAVDESGNPVPQERAKPNSTFRIYDGVFKVLAGGLKFKTPDQKLPHNNSEAFLKTMVGWLGSSINMPSFMVTGDFSDTNYTSGRLGAQGWDGTIDEGRDLIECEVLEKALRIFHARAVAVEGFFSDELMAVLRSPEGTPYPETPKHRWNFPTRPSIQPLITARANQIFLSTGQKTHAEIMTDSDVETQWTAEAKQYGISVEQYRRVKLAAVHGLTSAELDLLLQEDDKINESADSTNAMEEV